MVGEPGIGPGTSRTPSERYTTKPLPELSALYANKIKIVFTSKVQILLLHLTLIFYHSFMICERVSLISFKNFTSLAV